MSWICRRISLELSFDIILPSWASEHESIHSEIRAVRKTEGLHTINQSIAQLQLSFRPICILGWSSNRQPSRGRWLRRLPALLQAQYFPSYRLLWSRKISRLFSLQLSKQRKGTTTELSSSKNQKNCMATKYISRCIRIRQRVEFLSLCYWPI